LYHEVCDNAVKNSAIVKLFVYIRKEVFNANGSCAIVKLYLDISKGCLNINDSSFFLRNAQEVNDPVIVANSDIAKKKRIA